MSVDIEGTLTRLLNHAKALGVFEVARLTEFKSAPPNGLCFALWIQRLGPAPAGSGLAATSALLRCTARIYMPMLYRPESDIEPKVFGAASGYLGRLNGDLTLGQTVRNIDVLAEMADQPVWEGGYANIDNKLYRIADLPIGVIYNDSWEQSLS
jgi:hypothetical protein